ncbi:MAG: alanine racemase [Rhizobiales bacterium]|nr:alanine racemase [Hyphomicrobiales bacterium]NRB15901.1 alanine racemase [Hyphomicrobiales bacterium]
MFLDLLRRRNPKFIEAVQILHQNGQLPTNAFILDLDIIEANAALFKQQADKFGLKTFAMTKQVGRNSSFCAAIKKAGINKAVAVDMAGAIACHRAGLDIGHLGHLVQVPRQEANFAATLKPDYWTVFNRIKAEEAAKAAKLASHDQALMARIRAEGDVFYKGHEGGFLAKDIINIANMFDELAGGHFAGITTFPALLFDLETGEVKPTPNLNTLTLAREALEKAGRTNIEVNAPGTTSSAVLSALANAGATQVEPGNGLHGTTPLHAVQDLPELPSMLYLTEVSHQVDNVSYCFGGGLYIDPVFPDYQVKAIISNEPTASNKDLLSVEIPAAEAIDYYGMIDNVSGKARPGSTVIFGFRSQAFVTRALTVGVSGIQSGNPKVEAIENPFGETVQWPNAFDPLNNEVIT